MKTQVICEIGSNWRKLDDFKRSLEFARDNELLLKGQLWQAGNFYNKHRNPKGYEMAKRYEMPQEWVKKLSCDAMFWTAFDPASIMFLKTEINPSYYKVASLDSDQKWLVDSVARANRPTFMSVGVYGLASIRQAVKWYSDGGNIHNLTLMHSVNQYPVKDANLGYLHDRIIGSRMIPWGYSMNGGHYAVPAMAVAIGATAIEVHFRLDHIKNTPDAAHSLTKDGVRKMLELIKVAEDNLGNQDRPMECEMGNVKAGRRRGDGKR